MPQDSKNSVDLIDELKNILETMKYGSLEIYVQDSVVTQITVRNIRKTKVDIKNLRATKRLHG